MALRYPITVALLRVRAAIMATIATGDITAVSADVEGPRIAQLMQQVQDAQRFAKESRRAADALRSQLEEKQHDHAEIKRELGSQLTDVQARNAESEEAITKLDYQLRDAREKISSQGTQLEPWSRLSEEAWALVNKMKVGEESS